VPLSLAGLRALQQVLALPQRDQLEIFRTLAYRARSEESMPSATDLRDRRFAAGLYCPHCDSTRVQRHGRYKYENRGL
jgi:transposase-like protein